MLAETNTSKRVLRLRIKDKHVHELRVWAGEVNFVWNYCNELSFKVWDRERRFLSGFELQAYVNGATKGRSGHSFGVLSTDRRRVCDPAKTA